MVIVDRASVVVECVYAGAGVRAKRMLGRLAVMPQERRGERCGTNSRLVIVFVWSAILPGKRKGENSASWGAVRLLR